MIRNLSTFLFLLALSSSYGQDSLVYFSELDFHSSFEKNSFEQFVKAGEGRHFDLFIGIDPDITQNKAEKAHQRFDATIEKLRTSKALAKKPEKKIKTIYSTIHEEFFDQYRELNLFSEVFINGKYNCVSATALYALTFEELAIPFEIKEKPTHVYAVAYPQTDQILVEATDPLGGFVRFTDSNKGALIDRLVNAKIISSQERRTMSIDALFSKYYLSDQAIDIKQLIGIQYLNDAIYSLQNEDVKRAHSQAEKAWFFYAGERTKNLLLATNIQYLSEQYYEDEQSLSYLSQFARLDNIDSDFVLSEFNRMVSILLIEKGQPEKLKSHFETLIPTISDDELRKEMSYIYYYENGRIAYNQANYRDALGHFQEAYAIKPTNLDVANIFVTTMINSFINTTNAEMVSRLELYREQFPALIENNKFKSILLNAYLIQFGRSFDLKKEKEGLKYKQLFEDSYSAELTLDHNNIGRAYSVAAVYYFRKGYTSKAKNLLNEGLNISPHNHELLMRKRMIK